MASRARTLSTPMMVKPEPSGGVLSHMVQVFVQPRTFFRALPMNHQWLWVALLVLVIAGFTVTNQTQQSTAANSSTASSGFDVSTLQQSSSSSQSSTTTTQQTRTTSATATTSSNTTLMNGLLAAAGVVLIWTGQTVVLSMLTMLRGYSPQAGKNLQIAVWASLPLAVMLVLRYVALAAGGTGGALGLSLLLTQWSAYRQYPTFVQRVLEVFMSNLTLFWLWNLVLLYLGARYALGGRRLMVVLVVAMWIIVATLVPALVSEPQTRITRLPTSTTQVQTSATQSSTTTATQRATTNGQFSGGQFPGGQPPSGGPGG